MKKQIQLLIQIQERNVIYQFNSPKENNIRKQNTVILIIKIKIAPNDFREFDLKKYMMIYFFVKQNLVKPIVSKIFLALNKIFLALNNKIDKFNLDYLNSLYRLWIKNNR